MVVQRAADKHRPDGLWTIPDSGTLKAEITNADGSKEIIIKEILVR